MRHGLLLYHGPGQNTDSDMAPMLIKEFLKQFVQALIAAWIVSMLAAGFVTRVLVVTADRRIGGHRDQHLLLELVRLPAELHGSSDLHRGRERARRRPRDRGDCQAQNGVGIRTKSAI